MYLTGGGLPPTQVKDPTNEVLINIVNKKVLYGMTNPFDGDTVSTVDANVENIYVSIFLLFSNETNVFLINSVFLGYRICL